MTPGGPAVSRRRDVFGELHVTLNYLSMLDVRLAYFRGRGPDALWRCQVKCKHGTVERFTRQDRDVPSLIIEALGEMTCKCGQRLARACDECTRILWVDNLKPDGFAKVRCATRCPVQPWQRGFAPLPGFQQPLRIHRR